MIDLNNKVSDEDIASVQGGSDDFGDMNYDFDNSMDNTDPFADMDSFGGLDGSSGFDNLGMGDPFGGLNSMDTGTGGFGMGGLGMDAQPKSAWDKAVDGMVDAFVQAVKAIKTTIMTLGTRTGDEFGLYCANTVKAACVIFILGAVACLLRFALGRGLHLFGPSINYTISALLISGIGFIGLGLAAIYAEKEQKHMTDEVPAEEFEMSDYEMAVEDAYPTMFDEEEDPLDTLDTENDSDIESLDFPVEPEPIDYSKIIDNINGVIQAPTREVLLNIVTQLLRVHTPDFSKPVEIEQGTREFDSLNTLAIKALAKAAKKEVSELNSSVVPGSVIRTLYAYEFKMPRVKGLSKTDDIEREMISYFSDDQEASVISSDTQKAQVNCIAVLQGDYYKITITTGESHIITYGDLFQHKDVLAYFKNPNNKLPIVAGITELGKPIMLDAKRIESMLIAGKPRSGKSWHVLNLCLSMMFFNPPTEVQMVIIDPKESNLFRTVALLPHVIGLHGVSKVLAVFKELIEVEAKRRKKLLADNYCENVWDLRKRGIVLPILYIVIDEVLTIKKELEASAKEFDNLLTVILTQLPSVGIRVMLVPHRAQGVIDKTSRTNIQYSVAIRATPEVVKEVLDIPRWTIPLPNPGDTAFKIQDLGDPFFAHGVAVTESDFDNSDLMEAVAKIFHKSGITTDYPTWLPITCNRDEKQILHRLYRDNNGFSGDIDTIQDVNTGTDDLDSLY